MIFLDLNGVLADFDAGCEAHLGMPRADFEARYGMNLFWASLQHMPGFFSGLPWRADGPALWSYLTPLRKVVLAGLPRWPSLRDEKRQWVAEHLGPEVRLTVCPSRDKSLVCHPGDILIDDSEKYASAWELRGGIFIHHTTAETTISRLEEIRT